MRNTLLFFSVEKPHVKMSGKKKKKAKPCLPGSEVRIRFLNIFMKAVFFFFPFKTLVEAICK